MVDQMTVKNPKTEESKQNTNDYKDRMTITIKIADVLVGIRCSNQYMREYFRGYMSKGEADFFVCVKAEDIDAVKKQFLIANGKTIYADDIQLELYALQRKLIHRLADYNIVFVHGVALSFDGRGVLLLGASGVGKTTHAKHWENVFKKHAEIFNDDRTLLKIENNELRIYGSPWRGKEGINKNVSVPLDVVMVVERADKNEVREFSREELYGALLPRMYRDKSPSVNKKVVLAMSRLISDIPIIAIGCNNTPEAARVAYESVRKYFKSDLTS